MKTKAAKVGGGAKKTGRRQKDHGHGGANGGHPLLHPTSRQEGVADGKAAWFCDACMDVFTVPAGEVPTQCPAGHRADAPEFEGDAPRIEAPELEPDAPRVEVTELEPQMEPVA